MVLNGKVRINGCDIEIKNLNITELTKEDKFLTKVRKENHPDLLYQAMLLLTSANGQTDQKRLKIARKVKDLMNEYIVANS